MINLFDITKIYKKEGLLIRALEGLTFSIRKGDRVGILGKSGAGKSTLIRLIGGVELPTSGKVERAMTVSWPLALRGGLHPHLSALGNIRFLSRIYNKPYEEMVAKVDAFSELGERLRDPISSYSSGMRAKFSFGMSLSIEFDCYLIDEVVAVGDRYFRRKCRSEIVERRADRSIVMVARQANTIQEYCNTAILIERGRIVDSFDIKLDRAWRKYLATAE